VLKLYPSDQNVFIGFLLLTEHGDSELGVFGLVWVFFCFCFLGINGLFLFFQTKYKQCITFRDLMSKN